MNKIAFGLIIIGVGAYLATRKSTAEKREYIKNGYKGSDREQDVIAAVDSMDDDEISFLYDFAIKYGSAGSPTPPQDVEQKLNTILLKYNILWG